jgi:hypothetical protein
VIHRLTGWARALFYHPSRVAAAVRESALTQLVADRTRGLDIVGIGRDFPCDEATRRRFFEKIEQAEQATACSLAAQISTRS